MLIVQKYGGSSLQNPGRRGQWGKAAETCGRIVELLEGEWGMTEEAELQQAKRRQAKLLAKARVTP